MKEANGKEFWAEAMDQAREHFRQGWKELKRATDMAKEKGEDALDEAQRRAREVWQNTRAVGMENWEDVRKSGVEALDEVRERGDEAMRDAERLVRRYPTRAVALSALVGVLLGALLSKDRD